MRASGRIVFHVFHDTLAPEPEIRCVCRYSAHVRSSQCVRATTRPAWLSMAPRWRSLGLLAVGILCSGLASACGSSGGQRSVIPASEARVPSADVRPPSTNAHAPSADARAPAAAVSANEVVQQLHRLEQVRASASARATPIPMVCELLCFVYAGTTTTLPANLAPANPGGLPWDCTDTAAFITYNEAPPQDISVSLTGASTPACPEP